MFKVFTNFRDFDGCTTKQHLWCFDCWADGRQNRTWAVSDMSKGDAEDAANEYAKTTYGESLEAFDFFDPCYEDFMGNFPWWYEKPENKVRFEVACEIEESIPEWHDGETTEETAVRLAVRKVAIDVLRRSDGLNAHLGQIEDVVMADILGV